MADTWFDEEATLRAQYRVELLLDVKLLPKGIAHGTPDAPGLLAWSEVITAFTAEVGEPEGVRTILFDLLVARGDEGFAIRRFDADPGEDAKALAEILSQRLAPDCLTASIKSVATDGLASRWYPDIESFEVDAIREIR